MFIVRAFAQHDINLHIHVHVAKAKYAGCMKLFTVAYSKPLTTAKGEATVLFIARALF